MKKVLSIMAIFLLLGMGYAQQTTAKFKNYHSNNPDRSVLAKQQTDRQSQIFTNLSDPSNNSKGEWDLLYSYNFGFTEPGTFVAFYWNGKVYTSRWDLSATGNAIGKLYRFNISGNTLTPDGTITIPGITGNYNLEGFTTDGTYIYAVNESNRIYKINPTTWTVAATITTSYTGGYMGGGPIAIAYNEPTGGFWITGLFAENAVLHTSTGAPTSTVLTGAEYLMGLAYDNYSPGGPYLIAAEAEWYYLNRWNIATGNYNYTYGNVNASSLAGLYTYTAGGKFVLLCVDENKEMIFAYELANIGGILTPTNFLPTQNATGVALNTEVSVTFSENITANNLSGITISGVTATPSVSGNKLLIAHADFNPHTTYTVNIPANAINGYNQAITWSFTTGTVGISTVSKDDILIYPNPSTGLINIRVSENSSVQIFDLTGRIIETGHIEANATLTFTQSAGIYFIKVESNGKISTHKLVITK